jgi:hypothetical protein
MKKKIKCFLIIICCCSLCLAQQVVSTSGGHSENSSAKISWTIGEPVISTLSNGSYILTQGIHQSKLLIDAVEELIISGLEISAFPNPVNEVINLKVIYLTTDRPDMLRKKISFQLFDMNGKVLIKKQIESTETVIQMNGYAPSSYFLKVMLDKKLVKTFKIIKQ